MVNVKEILNQDVLNPSSVSMAGEDFIILDNPVLSPSGRFPCKNDWLIATLCEAGVAAGKINLREYRIERGGFIIILPGQVIVKSSVSEDFKGKILLMSRRFSETLDIGRTLTITASIEHRPYYQFQQEAIDIVRSYLSSCQVMIRQNPDWSTLQEILRYLTHAFFLGARPLLTAHSGASPVGPYSRLTEDFLTMVEKDYRTARQLSYYAAKLGRNVKYLSRRIKEDTGQNASDWIDRCVVLEAQAQMHSTSLSVMEISYSLGFTSQSFFGKYFKRVTGVSPSAFRCGKRR